MLGLSEMIDVRREIQSADVDIQCHKMRFHDAEDAGTVAEWREQGRKLVRRRNALAKRAGLTAVRHTMFDAPKCPVSKLFEAIGGRHGQLSTFYAIMKEAGRRVCGEPDMVRAAKAILADPDGVKTVRASWAERFAG